MIRERRIITNLMRGKLLFLATCLVLAGALMLPATSFGAWVTDSFNPNVTCNPDRPNPQECVTKVFVQPDGKVLVGGYISGPSNWLARFNLDGTPDSAFNSNVNSLLDGTVDQIVTQPTNSNKIIIGGNFKNPYKGMMRLNSDGTIDATFNPQLNNCDPSQPDATSVAALALQADGNLLVGGTFKNVNLSSCPTVSTMPYNTTGLHPFFVRLLTAGTGTGIMDATFTPNVSSTVNSIIVQDTGSFASNKKITAGGVFYKMQCTYCGTSSAATTTLHVYLSDPSNPLSAPTATVPACIDADGSTLVDYGQCMSTDSGRGYITSLVNYVTLLNMSNGSQDTSFNSARITGEDQVYSIARQSDGSVVVGGGINDPTTGQPYLQLLNSDGSIGTYPNASGPVNSVFSMPSGTQIITGGSFNAIGAVTRNNVALFSSPAGNLDTTFDPNANGPVYSVASSPSGTQIIIGGGFTLVSGVTRSYVARVYNDGKTTTSTSIIAPVSSYGSSTVTVNVSATTGTPTGQVGLKINSGPTTTLTLSNGSAVYSSTTISAGDNVVTATYAGAGSYAASFATGTLTVTPVLLTVTANNVSRPYLSSNPTFTALYTGFVNSQNSSVLTGTPSLTTAATSTSPQGTYPIIAAAGSLTAVNYGFQFVNGTLTITAIASATSVTSSSPTSSYGNPVTFTATVTSTATGSVTFMDGVNTIGIGNLSGGSPNTATYITSPILSGGTHTITAVYGGDTNFAGSTSSVITQTVNKASTTSSVGSSSPSAAYGSAVTFTATITSGATGTVTFNDNGAPIGTGTLSGASPNTATYLTSILSAGTHTITAVYNSDANFATSTSVPITQIITQASSITSVSPSANPSTYGSPVTFTATVTIGATGTVTFMDGAGTLGSGPLSGGTATYTTSALTVGSHSITAVYSGDTNFATSTSVAITQNVGQATSTPTVVSSSPTSTYGNPVTFTATVSGAGASGTVTFKDGAGTLGSGPLSAGTATYATSALTTGSHSITAVYSGDTNFATSTSVAITQNVGQATSTPAVVSSSPTSTYGNPVTFTATVSGVGASGTVTFKDGAVTLGSGPLSAGTATYTTSALTVGSHSITAVYSGDTNFATSTSVAVTQTINQASTAAVVVSNNNSSTFGTSVSFTATVTSPGGTPTGTVTFKDGATLLGTGTITSGVATYTTNTLGVVGSPHSITAVYNGDTNFSTSTSPAIAQTVNLASSTTSVSPSAASATYGSPVTFTANVTGAGATGTVTFYDGVSPIGTGTVLSGIASYTTSTIGVGSHSISAAYGGDGNYNTSSSSQSAVVQINKATTVMSITSNFQTSAINTPVTFTATIASAGGIPSGSVQFSDNGISLGSANLSGGTATLVIALSTLGTNTITATYNGDANFNQPSTVTPLVQTVVNYMTTTSILMSIGTNPSTYGTSLTFSSTVTSGSTGTPSGTVTFKDNGTTILGTSTLSNGSTLFSTSTLGGGSHAITAAYNGDANYGGSTSSPALTQFVDKANQIITFSAPAAKSYGDADFSPGAASNSGLQVLYASSNPAVATVVGNNIHIVGPGATTITASQPGDNNYNPAIPVLQPLTVNKANQTITFGALAAKTYGDSDFALGASVSSTLTVTYNSSNPAVATVVGNTIHIVGAGTTTITASQSGDSNYNAAPSVPQLLTVNKANQTITFGSLSAKIYGDADFAVGASASSSLPVTYTSSNSFVATIVGSNIHIVGAGTTTITVSQAGDNNYNAATSVQQPLNVVMADGKLNGNTGAVNATDALKALRFAAGIDTPTQDDLAHGDVAPLANGQRKPDGKIDIADVVAILRKAVGLPSW